MSPRKLCRLPADCGPAIIDYFWTFTDRRTDDECWPWKANRTIAGYGVASMGWITLGRNRRIQVLAHRLSLIIRDGYLPRRLQALHSCDNPPCVNPNHLRRGTARDNAQDRTERPRPRSIVTPEALEAIRNRRTASPTIREIMERYGLTLTTVMRVQRREREAAELQERAS